MLHRENQDKKRTARSVHSMRGKRGYVGVMRTPMDFMTTKEKKLYTKASEVKVTNFYNDIKNIPSLKDLYNMESKVAQNIVTIAKEKHGNRKLCEHWGISNGKLYTAVYRYFELPIGEGNRGRNKKSKTNVDKPIQLEIIKPIQNPIEDVKIEPQPPQEDLDLFEMKFINKDIDGDSIMDKVTNYISILSKDERYNIQLIIKKLK